MATVSGTFYWSYPMLRFGIVACTFFPTTFLEITVWIARFEYLDHKRRWSSWNFQLHEKGKTLMMNRGNTQRRSQEFPRGRHSYRLHIPLCRTAAGQCAFTFRGQRLWNSLPDEFQSITNLDVFKVLIKNDFLKHKQANINVNSRRFGIIMTPFLRQNE